MALSDAMIPPSMYGFDGYREVSGEEVLTWWRLPEGWKPSVHEVQKQLLVAPPTCMRRPKAHKRAKTDGFLPGHGDPPPPPPQETMDGQYPGLGDLA